MCDKKAWIEAKRKAGAVADAAEGVAVMAQLSILFGPSPEQRRQSSNGGEQTGGAGGQDDGAGAGKGAGATGAGDATRRCPDETLRPLEPRQQLGSTGAAAEKKLGSDARAGKAADPARAAAFERQRLLAQLVAMGCRVTITRHHEGPQQAPLLPAKEEPELSLRRRQKAYQAAHRLFWREIPAGE